MLAKNTLPDRYLSWNRKHGAPFGHTRHKRGIFRKWMSEDHWLKLRGPFSIQSNNSIREFEYPWAWHATNLEPGMRAVEIGGGFAGFQFALSQARLDVVNIDPGMSELEWEYTDSELQRLNRIFKTTVRRIGTKIEDAEIERESIDRIFCLSVLEHLDADQAASILATAANLIKASGRIVLTVDLFLNLHPFTSRRENEFGRNIDISSLIDASGLRLDQGDRSELFGFPEFEADRILSHAENYFIGKYPAFAQCFVLKK